MVNIKLKYNFVGAPRKFTIEEIYYRDSKGKRGQDKGFKVPVAEERLNFTKIVYIYINSII